MASAANITMTVVVDWKLPIMWKNLIGFSLWDNVNGLDDLEQTPSWGRAMECAHEAEELQLTIDRHRSEGRNNALMFGRDGWVTLVRDCNVHWYKDEHDD